MLRRRNLRPSSSSTKSKESNDSDENSLTPTKSKKPASKSKETFNKLTASLKPKSTRTRKSPGELQLTKTTTSTSTPPTLTTSSYPSLHLFNLFRATSNTTQITPNAPHPLHLSQTETSYGLWNVQLNIHATDVFGFGVVTNALTTLITANFAFLENQPPAVRWLFFAWEMVILSVGAFYLGRVVDILMLLLKLVDDGVRGLIGGLYMIVCFVLGRVGNFILGI